LVAISSSVTGLILSSAGLKGFFFVLRFFFRLDSDYAGFRLFFGYVL
jgi:hypothetical protein